MKRRCRRCKVKRPFRDFQTVGTGWRRTCKFCTEKVRRIWIESKEDDNWHRMNTLLTRCRVRSRSAGVPCTLRVVELVMIYNASAGRCAITGLPFETDRARKRSPYTMSIDRIVPDLGYVPGNVQLVLLAVNVAKNSWSINDLALIWRALSDRVSVHA